MRRFIRPRLRVFGLSTYSIGEESPADDATAGHETRSPVS